MRLSEIKKHIRRSENILNEIQDIDILMERLLKEARKISQADAGSIYEVVDNSLLIRYSQNDSLGVLPYLNFNFPIDENSMAGYAMENNVTLNVPDAYNLDSSYPFKFNPKPDKDSGYHTQSILTIPLVFAGREKLGVFQIINPLSQNGIVHEFSKEMEEYLSSFATKASVALHHAREVRTWIMRNVNVVAMRDPKETGAHVKRVSTCAVEIFDEWERCQPVRMEVPEREKFRDNLKIAAIQHDIGKNAIPDSVLKFDGRFEGENAWMRDVINTHCVLGARLFYPPKNDFDQMCINVILHHQEKWDGSGYPGNIDYSDDRFSNVELDKITAKNYEENRDLLKSMVGGSPLCGKDIPLEARIVALCDVFDALSHRRVYKSSWSEADVLSILEKGKGSHFDPELIDCFFSVIDRLRMINDRYPDD